MEQLRLFAGLVLLFTIAYDKSIVRFELPAFLKFLKILVIGSVLSIVLNSLAGRFPPLPPVDVSHLFLVGWEDVMFSLLSIYLAEKFLPKELHVPIMIIASFVFGWGHLYQGVYVAALLSIYPYVSYRLAKLHGYGTVIACHVIYDLAVTYNGEAARYLSQFL